MAKPPTSRGFTLAEKRALIFEKVALYAVFLVALIAATISFVALRAVGGDAGLGRVAFLLPIAIDGFGIACSVGIVRSVASGEGFRDRASEWVGLVGALGLSILGNIQHALTVGSPTLPDYVKVAFATSIPVIVAYGIHVYGRAMSKGISAHVMADDPDQLRFDVVRLGQGTPAHRAPAQHAPRTPTPAQPNRATNPPARTVPAQVSAGRAQDAPRSDSTTGDRGRARALFNESVARDPFTKPDAAAIRRELDITSNPATSRRWVSDWWTEHEQSLAPVRPEIVPTTPTPVEDTKVDDAVG